MNRQQTTHGGIGFFGALGILFIALKLCGVVDWPWLWVLAPIWGGAILWVLLVVILVLLEMRS